MKQTEMFNEDEMGSGKAPEALSDEAMVNILITQAHWTTRQPWIQIARRFAELSDITKSSNHIKNLYNKYENNG